MLEPSAVATAIPSLWSAVNSWFTPAVLFLLLNLMIATIALTSSFTPTSPPSHDHDIRPYPHEEDVGEGSPSFSDAASAKQSPSISLVDRVKSLGLLFSSSPGKSSSQQKRQPPPLISPEELYGENENSPKDPFEKQGHGSPSPVGKFQAFDLYGYLPGEPTSETPLESNPARYIFEPSHPQEVLLTAERDEKVEEERAVEDEDEEEEVDEKDESEEEEVDDKDESDGEEDEEARGGNGSEQEKETSSLLLQRGIRRSESLNAKPIFLRVGEEEAGSLEKRRPATVREGKGKWVDEEVDARADDFINRFKQQLKLQRMDSMARLKDATTITKLRSF